MAITEAQKRASEKYRKAKVKQISTRFYPAESDIWEWLSVQTNKQGYIKQLIRADMNKNSNDK